MNDPPLTRSDRNPPSELGHRNPLLVAWQAAVADGRDPGAREALLRQYSFAIPDEAALAAIRDASPAGLIEIGAGNGYWARLLRDRGVDVVAIDLAPAPASENVWFASVAPWTEVLAGDATSVAGFANRALLLVWPTRDEIWAADAVEHYAAAGGRTVVYVGEPPGGRTGDDRLHALIGQFDRCWSCAYDIPTTPCVCGVVPLFGKHHEQVIPQWSGYEDTLIICRRTNETRALTPNPAGRRRGRMPWATR